MNVRAHHFVRRGSRRKKHTNLNQVCIYWLELRIALFVQREPLHDLLLHAGHDGWRRVTQHSTDRSLSVRRAPLHATRRHPGNRQASVGEQADLIPGVQRMSSTIDAGPLRRGELLLHREYNTAPHFFLHGSALPHRTTFHNVFTRSSTDRNAESPGPTRLGEPPATVPSRRSSGRQDRDDPTRDRRPQATLRDQPTEW